MMRPSLQAVVAVGAFTTLDPDTGQTRWSRSLHPSGQDCSSVSPLVQASGGDPYVDGDRVTFGAATLGSGSTTGGLMEQPAVAGDVVFAGATRSLVAFDAEGCGTPSCDPLWTATDVGGINGAPAVSGGRVYAGSSGGVVAYGLP